MAAAARSLGGAPGAGPAVGPPAVGSPTAAGPPAAAGPTTAEERARLGKQSAAAPRGPPEKRRPPPPLQAGCLTKAPPELPAKLQNEYGFDGGILGQGAFAVVRRLRGRQSGKFVALKVVEKYPLHIRNMLPQLKREVLIQGRLHHRHILRLIDYVEDDSYVYMVLEHCAGGSLRSLCAQCPNHRLPEARAARYFAQILKGVQFLHQHRCVHRDLKPENMLLSMPDDEVRICDFGWSAEVQAEQALKTTCGTPSYWAPEIFEGSPQDEAVDLWALGALVYELLIGHAPFWGSIEEMRKKVLAADVRYPKDVLSQEAVEVFFCLLHREPRQRWPAGRLLLEHPWVRGAPIGSAAATTASGPCSTPGTPAPGPGGQAGIQAVPGAGVASGESSWDRSWTGLGELTAGPRGMAADRSWTGNGDVATAALRSPVEVQVVAQAVEVVSAGVPRGAPVEVEVVTPRLVAAQPKLTGPPPAAGHLEALSPIDAGVQPHLVRVCTQAGPVADWKARYKDPSVHSWTPSPAAAPPPHVAPFVEVRCKELSGQSWAPSPCAARPPVVPVPYMDVRCKDSGQSWVASPTGASLVMAPVNLAAALASKSAPPVLAELPTMAPPSLQSIHAATEVNEDRTCCESGMTIDSAERSNSE